MSEFQVGILAGIFIYSSVVAIIGFTTNDDDITVKFAIGAGWIFCILAVFIMKIMDFSKKNRRRKRRYE